MSAKEERNVSVQVNRVKSNPIKSNFLLLVTIGLFLVMYIIGLIVFSDKGFGSPQVFFNLFINNAGLIIAAVGMTFVLITGGIDISIGSVIGMTCMLLAWMIEKQSVNTWLALLIVLIIGLVFGIVQGFLVAYFKIQPFIVTLAGMFFARGLTAMISKDMISIKNETFRMLATKKFTFAFLSYKNKRGDVLHPYVYLSVIIALIVLVVAFIMLRYTRFGRSIYAVGGNEQSALLMGLRVKKVKFKVYVLNGFLAALAGVVFCFNSQAGFVEQARGFEMDAIASTVIGGTLLTGGVGNVIGSLFGVLIKGIIESFITFQGTLSSWWTRITIAALLCIFIVLQSIFASLKRRKVNKI